MPFSTSHNRIMRSFETLTIFDVCIVSKSMDVTSLEWPIRLRLHFPFDYKEIQTLNVLGEGSKNDKIDIFKYINMYINVHLEMNTIYISFNAILTYPKKGTKPLSIYPWIQ